MSRDGSKWLVMDDCDSDFPQGAVIVMEDDDGTDCPNFVGKNRAGTVINHHMYLNELEEIDNDLY